MKIYLFLIVDLILLATASYIGVGLFYQAAGANLDFSVPTVNAVRSAAAATGGATAPPLDDYGALIGGRNLFRTASETASETGAGQIDVDALEATKLELKLWGTLVVDGPGGNYAVIEEKKAGRQTLYQAGDQIQNALVKLILRERVVLEVGGKDEILQLEQTTGPPVRGPAPAPAPARMPVQVVPSAAETVPVNLDRKAVESALGDVGELMKQVRVRPYIENGSSVGLRLTGVAPDSIFGQMGVRNGDVLQAVDGEPIKSVEDVVNLYQSLGGAEKVSLQVRRGGRNEEIQFQIQD